MSNNPKVSVIIPCYNYGKFIDKAVESVLGQTMQEFEIIIINDGSTDKHTNNVLENFDKPKTRVILIENGGVAKARNIGIAKARGEYIFTLDADDYIEKDYIEKAVEILDANSEVGIVTAGFKRFGAKSYQTIYEYKYPDILVNNTIHNSSMFRKSDWQAVGGYKENMNSGWEDHDFWISIIALGRKVHYIPQVLIHYRIHKNTQSRQAAITKEQDFELFKTMYKNNKAIYDRHIEVLFENICSLKRRVLHEQIVKRRYKVLCALIFVLFILTMAV